MNDRKDNDTLRGNAERAGVENGRHDADRSPNASMRRRVMLRGAAAAVPTILTLHSGAALARSSNLLGVADGAPVDAEGRNLCVDESSVESAPGARKTYDLGDPPHANVTAIHPERSYYRSMEANGVPVSPQEMCQGGGDFYIKEGGALDSLKVPGAGAQTEVRVSAVWQEKQQSWKRVTVPKGGLVSATALASFAGSVTVRDI